MVLLEGGAKVGQTLVVWSGVGGEKGAFALLEFLNLLAVQNLEVGERRSVDVRGGGADAGDDLLAEPVVNLVFGHGSRIEIDADPSGVLLELVRERDFAEVVNEGRFATADRTNQEEDLVAERGQVVEVFGHLDWGSWVFDEGHLGGEGWGGVANDTVNFSKVALFPWGTDIGVPDNLLTVFVGAGIEDALEVGSEDSSEIVELNLFVLSGLTADEAESAEVAVGFSGCVDRGSVGAKRIGGCLQWQFNLRKVEFAGVSAYFYGHGHPAAELKTRSV